ncbi:hypothetical protein MHYP_G00045390, partial [Metynnis hypsauchen]
VIHTVGPIARGNVGPSQSDDLKSCYENSLKLVKGNNLLSVAFPCISTGIYGFPNEPAADIALKTVRDWVEENKDEMFPPSHPLPHPGILADMEGFSPI